MARREVAPFYFSRGAKGRVESSRAAAYLPAGRPRWSGRGVPRADETAASGTRGEDDVAEQASGRSTIIGALLISLGVIGGAFLVASALDRTTEQLEQVAEAFQERPANGARAAARPTPPARPRRPDPAQRYEVEVGEAPVRGEAEAVVTIVEWSDFQCPFCSRAG